MNADAKHGDHLRAAFASHPKTGPDLDIPANARRSRARIDDGDSVRVGDLVEFAGVKAVVLGPARGKNALTVGWYVDGVEAVGTALEGQWRKV